MWYEIIIRAYQIHINGFGLLILMQLENVRKSLKRGWIISSKRSAEIITHTSIPSCIGTSALLYSIYKNVCRVKVYAEYKRIARRYEMEAISL